MKLTRLFVAIILPLIGACANPINRVTSENYSETCEVAEKNGNLKVAEEACYRALVNVDWGKLGPELKSQKLYNLGRIKRQLAKFSEAEALFRESIAIEEKLSPPSSLKMGRRYIEISVSLAAQQKWDEGIIFLDRAIPISPQFSSEERTFAGQAYAYFASHLNKLNKIEVAKKYQGVAVSLSMGSGK